MDENMKDYEVYEVDNLVREMLPVLSAGEGIYVIMMVPDLKQRMLKLSTNLIENYRIAPVLKKYGENMAILRLAFIGPKTESNIRTNWILFLATIATVALAGYMHADVLYSKLHLQSGVFLNILYFTIALMSIVGIHELGHMYASKRNKIESTPPYFLPFPPLPGFAIGTMGAFIKAKAPIKNRDELFTLGIAGPIAGLIVAIIVTLIGLSMSFSVPETQAEEWEEQKLIGELPWTILLFEILAYIAEKVGIVTIGSGETLLVHPVAFAGWVGFLITGLNLLPLGQLDGGHVFRATADEDVHRQVTFMSVLILMLIGLVAMALLALFLFRRGHPGGLDDVTPISKRKKIAAYLTMVLAFLCLPIPISL
ncbi:MAG: site-2 protease family protein [Asgard group archaeon]